MTVGERIKNKRIELNMTQDELAKKVGYKSRSSIQKIEAARDLPLKKISLMALALDCSPGYLMGWEEQPRSFDSPEEYEKAWEEADGAPHPTYTVSWPPQRPILSDHENKVIIAYRKAPESIQEAVDKLLDINRERKESASCG
jgi:transcriptional regulator with XRE-family HTH domain